MEYQEEGIPWSHIDFQDNAAVLAMIEEPRRGLLSLLDEECMLPQGTDEAYASKAVRVREKEERQRGRQRERSIFVCVYVKPSG